MAGVILKSKAGKSSGRAFYRGVLIQPAKGASNLTKDQIRKAVKAAIDKNADACANAG